MDIIEFLTAKFSLEYPEGIDAQQRLEWALNMACAMLEEDKISVTYRIERTYLS